MPSQTGNFPKLLKCKDGSENATSSVKSINNIRFVKGLPFIRNCLRVLLAAKL